MYRTLSKKKIGDGYLVKVEQCITPTLPTPPPPSPLPTSTLSELAQLLDDYDNYMEQLMTDYHKAWNKREQLHKLYIRLKEDD